MDKLKRKPNMFDAFLFGFLLGLIACVVLLDPEAEGIRIEGDMVVMKICGREKAYIRANDGNYYRMKDE